MRKFDQLKKQTWEANILLNSFGLVIHTWGNVSQRSSDGNFFAIKPSGVPYAKLNWEDIVVVDLNGKQVDGSLRPSSDTPTHAALYRHFGTLMGIAHDHSTYATAWAQTCQDLPCFGTTHADTFYGSIPCTNPLSSDQVGGEYEWQTGLSIIEAYAARGMPETTKFVPGVLVASHGVFTFSEKGGSDAVDNALTIEQVAKIAVVTKQIDAGIKTIPDYVKDRHFMRKHGAKAYYGQSKKT